MKHHGNKREITCFSDVFLAQFFFFGFFPFLPVFALG